jgi:hypothetical protein
MQEAWTTEGGLFTAGQPEFTNAKNRLEDALGGMRELWRSESETLGLLDERTKQGFLELRSGLRAQIAWQEAMADRLRASVKTMENGLRVIDLEQPPSVRLFPKYEQYEQMRRNMTASVEANSSALLARLAETVEAATASMKSALAKADDLQELLDMPISCVVVDEDDLCGGLEH